MTRSDHATKSVPADKGEIAAMRANLGRDRSVTGHGKNSFARPPGHLWRMLVAGLLCLGASGCQAAGDFDVAAVPTTQVTHEYRLGAGDQVHIVVFNQQSLTGDYQIDGAGDLAFPLIGTVHAGGLTAAQVEKTIADKLSPDYLKDPNVTVSVLKYRPFYIVGEVKNPGSYPYVDGMAVINAVALAGGFTYRAREDDFYIRRADDPKKRREEAQQNTPVRPGDVIIVRERYF